MKLLYFSTGIPGIKPGTYGSGTAVYNAAAGMASRGHEVHLICSSDCNKTSVINGIVCHEFLFGAPDGDRYGSYQSSLEMILASRKWLLAELYQYWCEYVHLFNQGFVPDLIDCQDWRALGYFYVHHRLLGYKEAVAPILTFCHSLGELWRATDGQLTHTWDSFLTARRERYQMAASSLLAAPSYWMSDLIESTFHLPKPEVCYYNLDHARPESLLPPCDNDELLFFGQLTGIKGIPQLLRVCSLLWDEGHSFVLKLRGMSQPYLERGMSMADFIRGEYRQYIDRGLLKVFPHTDVFEEIKADLRESRAMVHPSLMEPLGLTCVEAMSYGRPVVASSTGGHAEVIEHGKNGFVCNDLSEMAYYIKRLLSASLEELEEWGECANERAGNLFSWEKTLPRRETLYEEVIRGPHNDMPVFPNTSFLDRRKFAHSRKLPIQGTAEPYVQDLLSVIIRGCDNQHSLRNSLQSIYECDYRPIEVIIMNSGNIDTETVVALEDSCTGLERSDGLDFRFVRQATHTPTITDRSLDLSIAGGEYICALNAGDFVQPWFFAKSVQLMRQYQNVGFVGGWGQNISGGPDYWVEENSELPQSLVLPQALPASVIRRSAYNEQKSGDGCDDWETFVSIAERDWAAVCIPAAVLCYRHPPYSCNYGGQQGAIKFARQELASKHPHSFKVFGDDLYLLLAQNGLSDFEDHGHEHSASLVDSEMTFLRRLDELLKSYRTDSIQLRRMPYMAAKTLLSGRTKMKIRQLLEKLPAREN